MEDRIDDIIQAFLDHEAMTQTASYLGRGRRFEGLSVDALNKEWAATFTTVCAEGDGRRATDLEDLGAELGLRKLGRPEHLVSQEAMRTAQERVRRLPPETMETVRTVYPMLGSVAKFRQQNCHRKEGECLDPVEMG